MSGELTSARGWSVGEVGEDEVRVGVGQDIQAPEEEAFEQWMQSLVASVVILRTQMSAVLTALVSVGAKSL